MRKTLIVVFTLVTLALAGCGAASGTYGGSHTSHGTPAPATSTSPGY